MRFVIGRKRLACVFALAFGLTAARANALPIVFSGFDSGANSTDPRPNSSAAAASFDAAAALFGSISTITFESAPLGAFASLGVAPGVTASGDGTTIVNAPLGTPEALYGYNTTAAGSRFAGITNTGTGSITFTFLTPTNFFGFYISGQQLGGETVTFNDGAPQTVPVPFGPTGGIAFVGFTDTTAFSSVTISTLNDIVGFDDVRFEGAAAAAAVPEPASLLLLGTGLAGLAARRRRDRS